MINKANLQGFSFKKKNMNNGLYFGRSFSTELSFLKPEDHSVNVSSQPEV